MKKIHLPIYFFIISLLILPPYTLAQNSTSNSKSLLASIYCATLGAWLNSPSCRDDVNTILPAYQPNTTVVNQNLNPTTTPPSLGATAGEVTSRTTNNTDSNLTATVSSIIKKILPSYIGGSPVINTSDFVTRDFLARQIGATGDSTGRSISNTATSITTNGALTNPAISGATITGSSFSGSVGTFTGNVTSSGFLGVGTTSPYANFSLSGTSGQSQPYFAIASTTGETPFFYISSTTKTVIDGKVLSPVRVGFIGNGDGGAMISSPGTIAVSGNYAYIGGGTALEIVDVSNPSNPVHAGAYATVSSRIAVAGNYVYSTTGSALQIIDVSKPTNPVLKGSITSAGATGVAVSGNYAYVGSNDSTTGLSIIDISNPASPILKARLAHGVGGAELRGINYVTVHGNYAYVSAVTADTLEIVDVSDPANPVHAGLIANGTDGAKLDYPTSIFVRGKYAYVTAFSSTALEIVDISNPSAPTHKGSIIHGAGGADIGSAYSVFVAGDYAYTVGQNYGHGIEIIDISDPANPRHKTKLLRGQGGLTTVNPDSVFVQGNYAYIAAKNTGVGAMEIVDVSGLTVANAEIGSLKVNNLAVDSYATFDNDLSIRSSLNVGQDTLINGTLSVSGLSGTTTSSTAVNISALFAGRVGIGTTSPYAKLSVVGEVVAPYYTATSTTATTTLAGGLTVAGNSGLTVMQNGNVGVGTSTPAEKLTVQGSILTAPPTTLTIKGSVTDTTNLGGSYGNTMAPNNKVFISGNYAYVVANTNNRLTIVDISNPSFPTVIGSISDAVNLNGPEAVYVAGNYAYVVSSVGDSITVVDVSNPVTPTAVAMLSDSTNLNGAKGIDIQGNYAYVTAYASHRLTIVDISNPYSPTVTGSIATASNGTLAYARSVVVSGNNAFVSHYNARNFTVVNISVPTSPVVSGSVNITPSVNCCYSQGISVSGRYAYVTGINSNESDESFLIIDISSSTLPIVTASTTNFATGGSPLGVSISGHYAYVTYRGIDRLKVYDISSSTAPFLVSSITSTPYLNNASAIAISGRYAYVLSPDDGRLTVVDIGGSDIDSLNVGSLSSGNIQANDSLTVNNNANIRGGMQVGPGGIYSQGAIGIKGSGSGTGISFRIQNSIGSSTLSFLDNGKFGLSTTTPSARLSLTQSANTAYGGIWLAETGNTDFRAQFMDTNGVMSFYGGDTAGTLNTATLNAAGEWTNASDIAYKTNIRDMSEKYGLATILLTSPRLYEMKGTASSTRIGFIAQELEQIIPESVSGTDGTKGISYGNLVAVAFQAIKDLNTKIDNLATEGIASISEWFVDIFTVNTIRINKGMEIVDEDTGETYCIKIKSGDWNKVKGACSEPISTQTATSTTEVSQITTAGITIIGGEPVPTPIPTQSIESVIEPVSSSTASLTTDENITISTTETLIDSSPSISPEIEIIPSPSVVPEITPSVSSTPENTIETTPDTSTTIVPEVITDATLVEN